MAKLKKLQRSLLGLSAILLSSTTFAVADWGYSNSAGPQQWAMLDRAYRLCATGLEQSPINITKPIATKPLLAPVIFYDKHYQPWSLIFNHGAIEALIVTPGSKNYVQWESERYQLIQFHFHWPSETEINGNSYPLELHFVNKSTDGSLAVIAVLFKIGKENRSIQIILNNQSTQGNVNFSIEDLLPKLSNVYNFNGSLTTPPCSQSVKWFVMDKPIELSSQQLDKLKQYMLFSNARPVQQLHSRNVTEYTVN